MQRQPSLHEPLLCRVLCIGGRPGDHVGGAERNRRRSAGRQERLALTLARAPEETEPGVEGVALAGERRARLLAAVESLREDDQLVIAARYFVGLSEAETAAALSLRPGTVKSRLSRALARLREALGETE